MKNHYTYTATSILGLLLALPNLAAAEDYYQKTRGYRVEPESDPPSYVRNLSKTQFEAFRDIEWLDVGLDFRNRYEYRENDLRPYTKIEANGVPSKTFSIHYALLSNFKIHAAMAVITKPQLVRSTKLKLFRVMVSFILRMPWVVTGLLA
jgi:hypothetical protein